MIVPPMGEPQHRAFLQEILTRLQRLEASTNTVNTKLDLLTQQLAQLKTTLSLIQSNQMIHRV